MRVENGRVYAVTACVMRDQVTLDSRPRLGYTVISTKLLPVRIILFAFSSLSSTA